MGYTGGTVRAKKLSLKSLALSGLFGAKCSLPQKSFSQKQSNRLNLKSKNLQFKSSKRNIFFVSMSNEVKLLTNSKHGPFR